MGEGGIWARKFEVTRLVCRIKSQKVAMLGGGPMFMKES